MIGAPILIDGAPTVAGRPSPHLGEHTEEILRETLPRHQWAGAFGSTRCAARGQAPRRESVIPLGLAGRARPNEIAGTSPATATIRRAHGRHLEERLSGSAAVITSSTPLFAS
jgi:hypothetical protein